MAGPRQARLVSIPLAPGILSNTSPRGAKSRVNYMTWDRWKDVSWVRWHKGLAEKILGWTYLALTTATGVANALYLGIARGLKDWSSLDGQQWVSIGTHLKLYVVNTLALYDITPMRASSNLTNKLSVVNASKVVTVVDLSHKANVGDYITVFGSSAIGGLSLDGQYAIATVTDENTYTFLASINATSTVNNGGGSFTITYDIYAGLPNNGQLLGYGTGPYGGGTYGTPRAAGTGVFARLRTWSLNNYGQDLVASYSDGEIYYWPRNSGPNSRAAILVAAPLNVQRVIVDAERQFIIALGCTGNDGNYNPMLVRWSSQGNPADWVPTAVNTAGGQSVTVGSRLITGIHTRALNLVWTDAMLYAMTFVQGTAIFDLIAQGKCKIVGPNAAAQIDGTCYFMAFDNFYMYDGTLNLLECEVWETVFDNNSMAPQASNGGDPYFGNVVLLLHMDGTNGASGSGAFVDSSSYAHVAGIVGASPTLNTSVKEIGTASALLGPTIGPGSGGLLYSAGTEYNYNGDFTIEGWFFKPVETTLSPTGEVLFLTNSSVSTIHRVIVQGSGSNPNICSVSVNMNSGSPTFTNYGISSADLSSVSTGVWHHFASVVSGTTWKFYLDGIDSGVTVILDHAPLWTGQPNAFPAIGNTPGVGQYYSGYLDEIRITMGVARYLANFTPALTPSSNFAANAPIAQVYPGFLRSQAEKVHCHVYQNKNEVEWLYPSNTGSGECDRYVTYNWEMGVWYYGALARTAKGDSTPAIDNTQTYPYAVNNGYLYQHEVGTDGIEVTGTNVIPWFLESMDMTTGGAKGEYTIGGSDARFAVGGSDSHLLVNSMVPDFVSLLGTINLYLKCKDRPQDASYTIAGPVAFTSANTQVDIRAQGSQIALRLDNAYQTPAGDTSFANVSLLLHCDGTNGSTNFVDSSANKNVMAVAGNAAISTATPKFGTGAYLAGSGFNNGISTAAAVGGVLDLGTGNFTIECFFNSLSANTNSQPILAMGTHGTDGFELLVVNPSAVITAHVYISGVDFPITHQTGVTKDVWHHLALVRNGNQFQLYLDGVGATVPSSSVASIGVPTSAFYVGYKPGFGSSSCDNIDEVRVTKGVARYTANFTPPTAAFQDSGVSGLYAGNAFRMGIWQALASPHIKR